ncbi:MAG: AAA family ATPase, partial [Patescibacteria group bacterium]|nr:AAA family ATPase [Patescibacteria group bacterium]
DLFNARATWAEVLEPHGWKKGNAGRWFRPGGNRESAFEMPETNNLWVFSTSTALPFEKALSKYAAYAVLNCGGDFSKAAGELAQKGYCVPKQEPQKARRAEIVTTPQIGARKQFTVASTKELMAKEFEPLQWAIDDLLPEGLTILAGAPKLGKSWLSLDIALAVSRGEKVMGGYATNKGEVLYLALEDSERRLQSRLNVIAEEERTADNAELFCSPDFPNMLSGGLECLEEFLKAHPNCRLVIIDTLAKFLPPNERGSNAYQADYKVMGVLQKLAMTFGVAILGVHHVRKQKSSDAFDDVSGSAGITGAADSSWLLKRGRNETTGTLMVTGRDIEEAEFSAEFDKDNCRWKLLGDATQDKRRRHLQILHDAFQNEQFSRSSAETFLRLSTAQAKRVLASMYQSGYLTRESTGTVGKKTHHYRLTEKIGQLIIKKQRDIFGAIRQ